MSFVKWLLFKVGPCSQGLHDFKTVSHDRYSITAKCRNCGKKVTAVE